MITSESGTIVFGGTIGNPVASSVLLGFLGVFGGSVCIGSKYLNAFGSTIGVLSIAGSFSIKISQAVRALPRSFSATAS